VRRWPRPDFRSTLKPDVHPPDIDWPENTSACMQATQRGDDGFHHAADGPICVTIHS
jgi:hypothetical protein